MGESRSFGLWSLSAISSSMGCEWRWKFFSSAPSFFASVLDKSDEEDSSEVSVFTVREVMLPMMLILSKALISLTSMSSLKMSVNRAI